MNNRQMFFIRLCIFIICRLYKVSEFWIGILCLKQWEAVVIPLFLTSLMYAGSFVLKFYSIWSSWADHEDHRIDLSFEGLKILLEKIINLMLSLVYNISAWRMYIVVSFLDLIYFSFLFTCIVYVYFYNVKKIIFF